MLTIDTRKLTGQLAKSERRVLIVKEPRIKANATIVAAEIRKMVGEARRERTNGR